MNGSKPLARITWSNVVLMLWLCDAIDVTFLAVLLMKVVVTLWCGGRTFDEEVIVAALQDADATALARNPSKGVKVVNRRIVVGE